MTLTLKISLALAIIISASATRVKDLENLSKVNVGNAEKTAELFPATVRKQLRGDADVCQIFRAFLENPFDQEIFENHSDWLIPSKNKKKTIYNSLIKIIINFNILIKLL